MDNLNIAELEKQNRRVEEEDIILKRRNVKFVKTEPDFDDDGNYFAVDKDGHVFADLDAIQSELKKQGAELYVFDGSGLPYAYKNTKGQLSKSDERISSVNQLPGNKFTPMKSSLAEDIVEDQADAGRYNKAADLRDDTSKVIKKAKDTNEAFVDRIADITASIQKLQKKVDKIKKLPNEPVLPGGVVKPVKPTEPKAPVVPAEPVKPIAPVKPDINEPKDWMPKLPDKPVEPTAPFKPVEPTKPDVLVDLEATKDLKHLEKPTIKIPQDPGPAPSYSKIALFFSRLFRGKDTEAYTKRLEYDVKLNVFRSDALAFPDKEKEYKEKLKEYNDREKILKQREETKAYNSLMEIYQKALQRYEEENKVFEAENVKYKEELKNYENALKEYESITSGMDANRETAIKENNAYINAMRAYDDAAAKYDADYEKYAAESAQYKDKLAQYERDANEYDRKSAEYKKDLAKYGEDLKKYEDALDKYPGGKEGYEKDYAEFTEKLKSAKLSIDDYHNASKSLEAANKKLADVKEEKKVFEDKLQNAKENISDLMDDVSDELIGTAGNLEEIEKYRDHIEVKLEGIADLMENNAITRKNLSATTWMFKSECSGKSMKDPVAVEKLYQYIACLKAEHEIRDKTKDYRIANPEAEGAVIRNLNNQQTVKMLKNDPLMKYILNQAQNEPISPEAISQVYFKPSASVEIQLAINEAKDSIREMMKEMEDKFGNKPIQEGDYKDFVRWQTYQTILDEFKMSSKLPTLVKGLRTDYYGNLDVLSGEAKMSSFYEKTEKDYKKAFDEVIKNQKAKEEATKDLPESTKRLMRLKVNYTLKDLATSVTSLKAYKAKAQKEGQKPEAQKANGPKASGNAKPKVMTSPKH